MIINNPLQKIVAPGPSQDFNYTLTQELVNYPASVATNPTRLPGCTVTKVTPAYSAYEWEVGFSGYTEGSKVVLGDYPGWEQEGNRIRRVGLYAPYFADFRVKNKYNTRRILTENDVSARPRYSNTVTGDHDFDSLAASTKRLLTRLTNGLAPSVANQCLFEVGGTYSSEGAGPMLVHNTGRMFQGMDWTGVSVARDGVTDGSFPATLISPRHALTARHTGIGFNTYVWFKRLDGSTQRVRVIGDFVSSKALDIRVIGFDQDVTGCAFYKTLSGDWAEYLPSLTKKCEDEFEGLTGGVPLVARTFNTGLDGQPGYNYLDSDSPKIRIVWSNSYEFVPDPALVGVYARYVRLIYEPLYRFSQPISPGDSSSPMFLFVPTTVSEYTTTFTPAIVSTAYTGGYGPFFPNHIEWINSQMDALSTIMGDTRMFKLETIDLNRFRRYTY